MENYRETVLRQKEDGTTITLGDVQDKQLQILIEFKRVCDKNNISFWLDWGTLLGAVRHHGFIPWDDDIDISVKRDDFHKLLEALEKDLDKEHFLYQSFVNNKKYNVLICQGKVRDINTYAPEPFHFAPNDCGHDGVFIDIFCFDNRSPSQVLDLFFLGLIYITSFPIVILNNLHIHWKWLKKLYLFISDSYHRMNKNSEYMSGSLSISLIKRLKIKKGDLFPLKEIEFAGVMMPVPNHCDAVLKGYYGDYMKLPDEQHRKLRHICPDIELDVKKTDH